MSPLRFAAFGHDDARLGGPEIGPAYLVTRDGLLCARPMAGDTQGLGVVADDLIVPPGEELTIHVRWAMPEFGYLWLQADNGGQLYRLPVGATQIWNLNYELARTRVLWNAQLEQLQAARGLPSPPKAVRERLAAAAAMLHDAMFANQDRRSRLADSALAKAVDVGERLAVSGAQSALRRVSGPQVPVVPLAVDTEQDAVPLRPVPVVVGQRLAPVGLRLRLAVPVSAASADPGTAELWSQVFDEGTVDFGAGETGDRDAEAEAAVERLLRLGGRPRGRALMPLLDAEGQPVAAPSADEAARWRREAVERARRWSGRIGTWELLPPVPGAAIAPELAEQIVATAEEVKGAFPEVELVLPAGEVFAHRKRFLSPLAGRPRALGHLAAVRRCLADTQAIDAVGIALYYPNNDLLQLMRTLDHVAEAGRPVHLLLAAAPSVWSDDPGATLGRGQENFTRGLGYWRRPWAPEVQAAYGLGLVLLAAAHPAVRLLEWSDFSDAGPHTFPYGGLVDRDGRPKMLFERLAALRQDLASALLPWAEEL